MYGRSSVSLKFFLEKDVPNLRINKFISEAGKASRRGADKLINERRVIINGKVAKIGDQVNPGDDVRVNGEQTFELLEITYISL